MDILEWDQLPAGLRSRFEIYIRGAASEYVGTEKEVAHGIKLRKNAIAAGCGLHDFGNADMELILHQPTFTEEDLKSFVQRRLHAGMGGAAEHGPRTPIIDPRYEITVHDEVIERSGMERSVSASDGVGIPLHDPEEAVRRISDPAIRKEWWPKVPAEPPATPITPPQPSLRKAT